MSDALNNRYSPLIKAIIRHTNIVSSAMNDSVALREDVVVPVQEWIVAELVVQQRKEYNSMVELSRIVGIPPSSFFRIVSHLQKKGLVDKYRVHGNKKNIVLRPTELALELYNERTPELRTAIWGDFCQELEPLSDSDISRIISAFDKLNGKVPSSQLEQELELVKLE